MDYIEVTGPHRGGDFESILSGMAAAEKVKYQVEVDMTGAPADKRLVR